MTNLHAKFSDLQNWVCLNNLQQLSEYISPQQQAEIFSYSTTPFTQFEFLNALEASGSVGENTGWLPRHFLYRNEQELGLFISYQKHHSYGEYVFDWAWADAYHRNGLNYYPKLLAAIPFSPVPCSKWLSNTDADELTAFEVIKEYCHQRLDEDYSSFHYLFPQSPLNSEHVNWIKRHGHQFHWFNQDEQQNQLKDFDQFLGLMTARKRKNILKERQKISTAGFSCYWKSGNDVNEEELDTFYLCYQSTYNKRGQKGYLNKEFFQHICQSMSQHVHILFCRDDHSRIVAAALYLSSSDTLYGRYWGSIENYELLHFEACYYQGIEFAIKHKLNCFNPGTQGEHKIARGFKPTHTYSFHHLTLEPFHQAVAEFCQREQLGNEEYMEDCSQRLPFKKD
ncbi:MAG: N-acetyltransferase [Gammaproteobacteria bacterium]|nr:N-acetyltransferase [Gammaproteobacteria bacterium]